jgi:hypothetical protein
METLLKMYSATSLDIMNNKYLLSKMLPNFTSHFKIMMDVSSQCQFRINVEPNSIDMLLIYTEGDNYLTEEEKESLVVIHGLSHDLDVKYMLELSRCPLLIDKQLREIDATIQRWIESKL